VQDYSCQVVYDELKPQLDCGASVLVGRNPGLKKVFRSSPGATINLLTLVNDTFLVLFWCGLHTHSYTNPPLGT